MTQPEFSRRQWTPQNNQLLARTLKKVDHNLRSRSSRCRFGDYLLPFILRITRPALLLSMLPIPRPLDTWFITPQTQNPTNYATCKTLFNFQPPPHPLHNPYSKPVAWYCLQTPFPPAIKHLIYTPLPHTIHVKTAANIINKELLAQLRTSNLLKLCKTNKASLFLPHF